MAAKLTPRTAQLRGAVTRLIQAAVSDSWKGAMPPEERPVVEEELKRARSNYYRALHRLEQK